MDMRYKKNKEYSKVVKRNRIAGLAVVWFFLVIAFLILWQTLSRPQKALLSPLGQTKVLEVVKVQATDNRFCDTPIKCIRDVGEELGRDNQTIMQMIRIAKFESRFNPLAKNKSSSASGLFQIIAGTWYSNDCVGDKWNAEDNTRCAYKIQDKRGFQPWEVFNTGLAK